MTQIFSYTIMSRANVCPGAPSRPKRPFSVVDAQEPPAPPALRLPPRPVMNEVNQAVEMPQQAPPLPHRQKRQCRRNEDESPPALLTFYPDVAPAA